MLIEVNREEAMRIMEENLKILKECSDSDTFLLLSSDLEKEVFIGRSRVDRKNGIKLIKKSKTFVLIEDSTDKDVVSILSLYTSLQKDIYNIIPIGKKHDMIIIPQLE